MCRSLHYGSRLFILVAVFASVSLLAPAPQQAGPYVSALSSLVLGTDAHTASCPQQYCPGLHTQCGLRLGIQTKCKITGQGCSTVNC